MPPAIDREARERDIYEAAMRLLNSRGPGALTLRNLAKELGGSIMLVTHVYPDRESLMKGITKRAIAEFDHDLDVITNAGDDKERLRLLLEWMLPLGEGDQVRERGRVMLVGYREPDLHVNVFFVAMERKMRSLLRLGLEPFFEGQELEDAVENLRVWTNGVVLSTAEHPGRWTRKRIRSALAYQLRLMGLG